MQNASTVPIKIKVASVSIALILCVVSTACSNQEDDSAGGVSDEAPSSAEETQPASSAGEQQQQPTDASTAATETAVASEDNGGEWGTLKGRFIYDGDAPKQEKLNVTKDVEACTKVHPLDESLVVSSDGGLANVIVYIRPPRGESIEVHPDYKKDADQKVVLNNLHCRFAGHITLLETDQTLVIKNDDPVGHNTKADFFKASSYSFNQQIPAGGSHEVQISRAEGRPVPVQCNIHPWMIGYLLVRDDPYMAVSAEDGTFAIENIPVGEHEFQFWQETSGYLKNVSFTGGQTGSRGRADLNISAGVNDLGDINVSPELFEGK